jgi:uncharacterized membrane protein YeiH
VSPALVPAASEVLDVLIVLACAVLGALSVAARRLPAPVILVAAVLSALGGGLVRDLVLGVPPVALQHPDLVCAAVAGGVAVLLARSRLEPLTRRLDVLEALGAVLFCVYGAARTSALGHGAVLAVLLGLVSALGGGVVLDVALGRFPAELRRDRWAAGAPILVVAVLAGVQLHLGVLGPATGGADVLFGCAARVLALRAWPAGRPVTTAPAAVGPPAPGGSRRAPRPGHGPRLRTRGAGSGAAGCGSAPRRPGRAARPAPRPAPGPGGGRSRPARPPRRDARAPPGRRCRRATGRWPARPGPSTATRRPRSRPSPVTTDPSCRVRAAASASSRAQPGATSRGGTGRSQEVHEPGSSTSCRSARASSRAGWSAGAAVTSGAPPPRRRRPAAARRRPAGR